MKHFLRTSLAAAALALTATNVEARIPLDYYYRLQGLSGEELKDAIHATIAGEQVHTLSFGSGNNYTWWGLYVLDRNEDNTVIDRYSNETFYFGDRGSSIEGTDIEHAMPKSWWKPEDQNTDWVLRNTDGAKDLHQLMPAETKINISKSNNPIGEVVSADRDNGVTKVGKNASGRKVWEPGDQWKGDFARIYMYMATAYQDYVWTSADAEPNMVQGNYPTLNEATSALLLKWARNDQVSPLEVKRANTVQTIQNNRNPYVDFPNLMEYVWGDSIGQPFDLLTTVKADDFFGTVLEEGEEPIVLYENTMFDDKEFTVENVTAPTGVSVVWKNDAKYGWQAHGGTGSTVSAHACYDNDSKLVSPTINLTWWRNASFHFTSLLMNYSDLDVRTLHLLVRRADGTEVDISDRYSWQNTGAWNINNSKPSCEISLNDFVGEKINIVFHYTSDADQSYRWGVREFVLTASGEIEHDGVIPVFDDELNLNAPVEFYTIDGRRIADPASTGYRGIVIRRQGSNVTKLSL